MKYVGGKTQLLKQFEQLYPQRLKEGKVTKYFELFLGGGAVFFDVIQKYPIEQAFLNDINQDLILAYQVIKNQPNNLIELLHDLSTKYQQSNTEQQKDIFYLIRDEYNRQKNNFNYNCRAKDSLKRVSWLLFLNKTCFNGLYRTNQKGQFNVPFGKYKNPQICDRDNILSVARILEDVKLISGNYDRLDGFIDRDSFVYLDPPYRPIAKTSSFTSYTQSSFNDRDQLELSKYCHYLTHKGAKVMISNSNPHNTDSADNFFYYLYDGYRINEVFASRMVNSDATKRGKITELVITNY